MKRTFFAAAAALITLDVIVMRRWERIIQARIEVLQRATEVNTEWAARLNDWSSHLTEREEIASAMFAALADARSALLATIENMTAQADDEEGGQ